MYPGWFFGEFLPLSLTFSYAYYNPSSLFGIANCIIYGEDSTVLYVGGYFMTSADTTSD
jgi:hypothetical protein